MQPNCVLHTKSVICKTINITIATIAQGAFVVILENDCISKRWIFFTYCLQIMGFTIFNWKNVVESFKFFIPSETSSEVHSMDNNNNNEKICIAPIPLRCPYTNVQATSIMYTFNMLIGALSAISQLIK